MTLSDPEHQFQGHSIKANIWQTVHPIHYTFGSGLGFRGRRIEWRYLVFAR